MTHRDLKPDNVIQKLAHATVTVAIMLGLVLMTWAWAGCSKIDNVVDRGKALLVDCTKAEAARAITELGPLVEATLIGAVDVDGKVDFDPIKNAAQRWTADIGGCVLADVVNRALTPPAPDPRAPKSSPSTPLEIHPAELRQAFEAFRSQRFGEVTFQLAGGSKL